MLIGQPEPTVAWFNGTQSIQTTGAISMARNVIVNRLEVQQVTRDAFNTTYKCQVSNTKLVPPAERLVRLDMLCKFILSYMYVFVYFYIYDYDWEMIYFVAVILNKENCLFGQFSYIA